MIEGKKVLILSLVPTTQDARVLRQIDWFKERNQVTIASPKNPKILGVRSLEIPNLKDRAVSRFSKLKTFARLISSSPRKRFWSQRNSTLLPLIAQEDFDVLITNDFSAIPYGLKLKEISSRPFYWLADLHEYSLDQGHHSLKVKLFQLPMMRCILADCFQLADLISTVSPGLATLYRKQFGRQPIVIENSPAFTEIEPRPVDPDRIRLVYHGGINRSRKLDQLIEAMKGASEQFELHLYLLGKGGPTYARLLSLSKSYSRIFIHDPVPPHQIVQTLNQYDIGIYVLPPTNLNHIHALPNKIFDFIQARLMLATGPSPEMKSLIDRFQCGVYTKEFDYSDLLKALAKLSPKEIMVLKANSGKAAQEYHAEKAQERLAKAIQEDLSSLQIN